MRTVLATGPPGKSLTFFFFFWIFAKLKASYELFMLNFIDIPIGTILFFLPFSNDEIEAQRGPGTCPRMFEWVSGTWGVNLLPNFRTPAFNHLCSYLYILWASRPYLPILAAPPCPSQRAASLPSSPKLMPPLFHISIQQSHINGVWNEGALFNWLVPLYLLFALTLKYSLSLVITEGK